MDNSLKEEFELFAAYYSHVAKQPINAAQRMAIVKLNEICKSRYSAGQLAALVRANKPTTPPQPERQIAGKERGDRSERRSPSPVKQGEPTPLQKRLARIADRQGQRGRTDKLATPEVVADSRATRRAKQVVEGAKEITETHFTERELSEIGEVQLSTGEIFNTETGRTENDLNTDARELPAKELIEKYGRDLVFERLTELGEPAEMLEQKTDRQLANLLKKRLSE